MSTELKTLNGYGFDATKLGGLDAQYYAQGRAAYNLLDNSDFMINQRGQTSYSGNGYSIDRWEAELAGGATFAISVSSDKVTISKTGGICRFYQILPKSIEGKTVTYAIKTGDGIFFGTCTVSAASESVKIGNHTAYLSVYQGSGKSIYSIFFNDSSEDTIEIYWAALYEGAYTADTLPAYVPKGKHVEMLNCGVPLQPHNLLDNSDFTNPVNQRGATTATLGKYFIDRWNTEAFSSGPSITIDSNGLTLLPTTSSTAGIYQILPDYENRKGKVHTFAICVDNVWKCVSFTMGNFGAGYFIHGLAFFSVDNRNILIRNNASDTPVPITIQRVALYEGSYDASTLPAYQPKGYTAELAACQLYYLPLNHQLLGSGYTFNGGAALLVPRKMRIDAPSFVASGTIIARVNGANYPLTLSSVTTYGPMIKVDFASNTIPVNYPCAFYSDAPGVSLNADL